MSNKCRQSEAPFDALKNESARQRWELFHRAIAHAKQTSSEAVPDADNGDDAGRATPLLTIVR